MGILGTASDDNFEHLGGEQTSTAGALASCAQEATGL